MEWQQLEYFQKTAELEHITDAAESLALTQPALSRSISRLEAELGVPLFDRKGRSIYLNHFGKLFLKRVNKILGEYEHAKEEINDLLRPDSGEISIGFIHSLGVSTVPDLIRKFELKYPKANFVLSQNSSKVLLTELEDSKIDFGIGSFFDINPKLSYSDLFCDELFILVPKDHPLANNKKVDIEEVKDFPIVSFKEGYALRILVDRLFEEHKIKPKYAFEGEDAHTIAGIVGAGLGIGIAPDIELFDRKKIVKIAIGNSTFRRTVSLAWNENTYLSPISLKFRQFVIDYYNNK